MSFTHFPEEALTNVLARFPLKNIAIYRSMSKEWRFHIDFDFFRDYYISQNSSSSTSISWSILEALTTNTIYYEIVGHHGCQRWGLARSPGSFPSFYAQTPIKRLIVLACTDGLVSIYIEDINGSSLFYIGNPLLRDWFQIPLPPSLSSQDIEKFNRIDICSDSGLVTKMENGVVVTYKFVWILRPDLSPDEIVFMVYSSDTGLWEESTLVVCANLRPAAWPKLNKPIALNRVLHWLSQAGTGYDASSLVAYDFYGASQCHVIRFPHKNHEKRRYRRTFTTTEGSIVYFNEFHENKNRRLRVLRLVKYERGCPEESWQLIWEINLFSFMKSCGDYFPVVMHPLDSEIIYLWSDKMNGLILFNLRTHVLSFHKETEPEKRCLDGSILSFDRCEEYMAIVSKSYLRGSQNCPKHLFFLLYVLPRWLHRLPHPPPT